MINGQKHMGCDGHCRTVAKRNYPTPKVRGSGQEEQHHLQGAVVARAQEGLEELFQVQGQEWGVVRR